MKYLLILFILIVSTGCFDSSMQKQAIVDENYLKLVDRLVLADKEKERIVVFETPYLGCLTALSNRWAIDAGWTMAGGIDRDVANMYIMTLKKSDTKYYLFRQEDGKLKIGERNETSDQKGQ